MDRLNPVTLITGAASGVGAPCVREMARRSQGGLVLVDLDDASLCAVADDLEKENVAPERVSTLAFDVADEERWMQATDFIEAQYGRLDWAVLYAGMPKTKSDLLDFRRMDAGFQEYRMETLPIPDFVSSIVKDFSEMIPDKDYRIEVACDNFLPSVYGDRRALGRARSAARARGRGRAWRVSSPQASAAIDPGGLDRSRAFQRLVELHHEKRALSVGNLWGSSQAYVLAALTRVAPPQAGWGSSMPS